MTFLPKVAMGVFSLDLVHITPAHIAIHPNSDTAFISSAFKNFSDDLSVNQLVAT